jgi:hypothetical protein
MCVSLSLAVAICEDEGVKGDGGGEGVWDGEENERWAGGDLGHQGMLGQRQKAGGKGIRGLGFY